MKRFTALMLILAALVLCAATSEVSGNIENDLRAGSFILNIPIVEGDDGTWRTEIVSGGDVVKQSGERVQDGVFQARFDPVSNGEATVAAQRFEGIVCDRAITWTLVVSEGKVEVINLVSDIEAPATDVTGEWREAKTQFTAMTIAPRPDKGWDVEITSPLTHGAYIFRARMWYDCALNAFVYDDGTFYDIPLVDGESPKAVAVGTAGNLTFDDASRLIWQDSERNGDRVIFEPIKDIL